MTSVLVDIKKLIVKGVNSSRRHTYIIPNICLGTRKYIKQILTDLKTEIDKNKSRGFQYPTLNKE